MFSKKPQGTYSWIARGVNNPEELKVENADKLNPFLFWDESSQQFFWTDNPERLKVKNMEPRHIFLPIGGDGWALVDYVWKIKPPQR